jgi:L-fuculose-phosphate aldolase
LNHKALREEVVLVSRRMSEAGLAVGTSGNVSARTPDGKFLVASSGRNYAAMEPEDAVLPELDGAVFEGSFEPSVEWPMHAGIYRAKPETGDIVRTHARYATALACLNWEVPPIHYMLAALSDEGRVPLASHATYGTEELARNVADALGGSHTSCLLANYGTIAVGASVGEAYSRTELLEEMAGIYYRARAAGEPVTLSPAQIAEVAAKLQDYGQSKPSSSETG